MAVAASAPNAADALQREWRQRRSMGQLEVASRSPVSARHLSSAWRIAKMECGGSAALPNVEPCGCANSSLK
jgi:hypothetical protein